MASSYTTNLSKETDNQDNKSNQSSETSDESKNVLPTSPPNVEETIEVQRATIIRKRFTEQQNDLSPHLITKRSYGVLAALPISATSTYQKRAVTSDDFILRARPFEEILVTQPTTDTSSGTSTKPGESKDP